VSKNTPGKNIQQTIDKAKEDFKDEFMVAFLGEKYSGKTVTCALIKDALVRHYEKYSNENYIGICTEGSIRMNNLLDNLSSGKFPPKTLPDEADPITLEIISREGSGNKIKIVLRDMAGEKRKDLLVNDFGNTDDRLQEIFSAAPIENKSYGLLTHVVFSKIYIIVIDSSKFNDDNKLRNEESYVKDTIRRLHEIKERVGELTNKKIHDPLIFIFTKYDRLKEALPPEELIKKMPEVTGALKYYHSYDNIAYFKSSVDSEKLSEDEIRQAIEDAKQLDREDLREAESDIKDKEIEKEDAKSSLEEAKIKLMDCQKKIEAIRPTNNPAAIAEVQQSLDVAQVELKAAETEYTEAIEELDNARKKLNNIKENREKNTKTAEDLGISEYKPKIPLAYNLDDYLALITYIIKMNKKIRGF